MAGVSRGLLAAGVQVAALGGDVPVAAAALDAAADDRVAQDDRLVRLRRHLGHEVGLDDADAAAARRGVAPDGEVDELQLAVGVVEEAAAAGGRDVAGDGRVLDQRVAVGQAEEAAAVAAFLDVAVLAEAGMARDVAEDERAADDQVVVGRVRDAAAVLALFRSIVVSRTRNGSLEEL